MKNWRELAVIPIAIVLIGGFLLFEFRGRPGIEPAVVPDFGSMTDVKQKKLAFFEFMLPIVRKANNQIWGERQNLKSIRRKLEQDAHLNKQDIEYLDNLNQKYRLKADSPLGFEEVNQLLTRVDTIPASLALAQAANESAWGTARFARNGNNYYGIWCWAKDCGLVPDKREAGAKHEVAAFGSIDKSVSYYLLTLNSHPAYDSLRDIRSTLREREIPITGHVLANGLISYSERRDKYVEEIQTMIRQNQLDRFTSRDNNLTF